MLMLSDGPSGTPREHPQAPALFASLDAPFKGAARRRASAAIALALHGLGAVLLLLFPVLWLERPGERAGSALVFLYDPPPPPPPPLPKGSGRSTSPARPRSSPPADRRPGAGETDPLRVELPLEVETPLSEPGGSPTGSDVGTPEGMEGGVPGGVVGGVPGGVLGGVLGGTGSGPVTDYESPPRLIHQTPPVYPREAFLKRIEGTVIVELLIDSRGRVARTRVVQSIPALDRAALQVVQEWIFAPAIKHGRPVAALALAPISFKLY